MFEETFIMSKQSAGNALRFVYGLIATIVLIAAFSAAQTAPNQRGTILGIQPTGTQSAVHKATDAPPPDNEAAYDVTVQIGDMVYVARYKHASDYVPSNWVVGQPVDARVGKHKHRVYLKDMAGKEVALPIVTRKPANGAAADK